MWTTLYVIQLKITDIPIEIWLHALNRVESISGTCVCHFVYGTVTHNPYITQSLWEKQEGKGNALPCSHDTMGVAQLKAPRCYPRQGCPLPGLVDPNKQYYISYPPPHVVYISPKQSGCDMTLQAALLLTWHSLGGLVRLHNKDLGYHFAYHTAPLPGMHLSSHPGPGRSMHATASSAERDIIIYTMFFYWLCISLLCHRADWNNKVPNLSTTKCLIWSIGIITCFISKGGLNWQGLTRHQWSSVSVYVLCCTDNRLHVLCHASLCCGVYTILRPCGDIWSW